MMMGYDDDQKSEKFMYYLHS